MSDGVSDGEVDEDSGFVMPRDRNSPSSIQDFNQAEYSDTGYGKPKDAPSDIPKSYNEMFLEIIFKYANMDDHWELCVFDDELSRDSSDGGDSTRINVNENYIEKFSNFPKAAARIEKLRHFIYGDSIYGGSSDTELRSGSLDQETFRINWQRIYTADDSCHIFWYTTVLSNAHMYVPQLNQTEHENFDTEMNVVAYPAVFRQEQFGNDIMVIKKQFTDYKQLLASVKELRPPLDGRRPTRAIKSRQMIDNYMEPPFVQRLEKQRDPPTARPFSRNEERARERNLKQTRAREIGNKAEARLYNGADDEYDPVPHSGIVRSMSEARREIFRATAPSFPARGSLWASTTASHGLPTRASRAQSVAFSPASTCLTSTSRHSSSRGPSNSLGASASAWSLSSDGPAEGCSPTAAALPLTAFPAPHPLPPPLPPPPQRLVDRVSIGPPFRCRAP